MVSLMSRTGRHLQRYDNGRRLIAGCIPYRFTTEKLSDNGEGKTLEVLMISSQKGCSLLFPKGGWEKDESLKDAVRREALEEAGVQGKIEKRLARWTSKSKRGYMFPLRVTEQLDHWPEKHIRERMWVSVAEAREMCKYPWMMKALDQLVSRYTSDPGQTMRRISPHEKEEHPDSLQIAPH
ncbi:hypothetical protein AMTRI_Chr04g185230 [Amborella trichopoda]|uniref:Nudix hydrolase domain-containing protein n=1 Tax=Amborella trichopoda TaxID=13333 RepID=W1NJZ9_AMBTC|nr:nudix hydrolase 17, mitochondrial isoform X2 [Amborella trichopoda]ERM95843.1 hypothetical protein AMTR_s00060p00096990 [Amborella trichopoda]|eukprot:XP_006828427.1 nudix hydrolase 17, mitochondrial isoform X2 [Amborella trichopoda]